MAESTFTDGVAGAASTELVSDERAQLNPQVAAAPAATRTAFIKAASAAIVTFCGRPFVSDTVTEYYNGDGSQTLTLRRYPVTTLTTITIIDTDADDTDDDIDGDEFRGWADDANAGIIRFKPSPSTDVEFTYFPAGHENVKVAYTAGYADIPEDIQEACVQTVAWLLSANERDAGLTAEKLGDYQYTRESSSGLLPPVAKALLARYRNVRV